MTHIPLRMCVACRTHRPATEMIRVTYRPDTDSAVPDTGTKSSGRGAYICRDEKCIKKAQKKHVIERHLGCIASDELYARAEEML